MESQVQTMMKQMYGVTLIDNTKLAQATNQKSLTQIVCQTPIEELLFSTTPLDGTHTLQMPLLIEIKQLRNVSKPFQRATDVMVDDELKEQKIGPKKGQMYQLIAHDGVRFVKLVLMFKKQSEFVSQIRESNKFLVSKESYFSKVDNTITFLIDDQLQLSELWNDKRLPKIQESFHDIKGLSVKYTTAPRFKFINDKKTDAEFVEHKEEEVEDEFADLFAKFNVVDLTAQERNYINRFQQLGFWRKKF